MKVSVVVCTLDKKQILPEVIPNIKRSSIVDELIIVEGLRPVGYARDSGWRKARNPLICFIDDDEVVPERWIERLAMEFNDPKVGAVSSTLKPLNPSRINRLDSIVQNHALKRFSFHARFVRKKAMEDIGGFEHTIGGETVYAAWRMKQMGWKIKIVDYPLLHRMSENAYSSVSTLYRTGRARAPELLEHGEFLTSYRKALGSPVRGLQLSIMYKEPTLLLYYPMRSWLYFLGAIRGSLKTKTRCNQPRSINRCQYTS